MSNIPLKVKQAAGGLIAEYGDNIKHIGEYKGKEAYLFRFPKDIEVGFPVYFLYDGKHVDTITGFEALRLGSIFFKD